MPRATTRNTTSASLSQSQARDKQGGRTTRSRPNHVEDEDEDDSQEHGDDDGDDDAMGSEDGEKEGNGSYRKVNDLVRLALFTEYRRTLLRRDDITKKVFGGPVPKYEHLHAFRFAQHALNDKFGMQLHEIMSRAERDKADAAREGASVRENEGNVTGLRRRGKAVPSKQYILRSILSPALIEAASTWDHEIEEAERAENARLYPNDPDRRPEGTLIAWRHASADLLGATGVLHVILALILVNGRVISDMQLKSYLKRMRLPPGSAIPSDSSSHFAKPLTIDSYLTQLVKQSYLDKQKTSLASAQTVGQKRGRRPNAGGGDDGDASYEWKWGTRALAEIGEEGVGAFVADFMNNIERERESKRAGEEHARGSGRKEKEMLENKEKLLKAIGRAAGGGLVPYKQSGIF